MDTSVSIVSTGAFITDNDLDPRIESASIILTNPQLSGTQEYLSIGSLQQLQTHSSPHNITITGSNTLAVYQAAFITSLKYNNFADEPLPVPRVIQFTLYDGRNYNSPVTVTTIQITAVNDAPNVYPSGNVNENSVTFEFSEGIAEALVPVMAPRLLVSDSDDSYLESAFAGLARVFDEGDERIYINLTVISQYNITCVPASCAGQNITLSGHAPVAHYQTLLRSLQYINYKQPTEFPSLFDRIVNITVNDGELVSSGDVHVLVDIVPVNPRVIIDLDTPNHNYNITYVEGSGARVPIAGALRWVDISLDNLLRMVVGIRYPHLETGEQLIANDSCIFDLGISADDNLARKEFTFGSGGTMESFLGVIDCLRYQNTEPEPIPIARYIDFTFVPGGGAPSGTAVAFIAVSHINDNVPQCNTSSTVTLPEETGTGVSIHTLQATDADVGGGHNVLTYSLVSNWPSLFSLSTDSSGTASISLLSQVDYDQGLREYPNIIVQACDVGAQCCNFTFSFEVTDFNDNPPVFVNDPYTVAVSENLNADILNINFTDLDSGVNGELSDVRIDSIHPGSGCMNRFEVVHTTTTAVLRTVNGGLDYEAQTVCYVHLIATDAGQPSLSSSSNVTVNVVDEDDRPPMFLGPYRFEIEEDIPAPAMLGTLSVTDPDTDPSLLVFSVLNTDLFNVTNAGVLFILFSANSSIATSYSVNIRVSDPAGNSLNFTIPVNILAINNEPPVLVLNNVPVVFIEESNTPVTLNNTPSITDPDNVTLTITRISAVIANGESSTLERLSVAPGAPAHVIGSSPNPFELLIMPTDSNNISAVLTLLQNIQYINTQDEPSPCRSDLFPCTSNNSRSITISVYDGNFYSRNETSVVRFSFINDAPEIDLDTTIERNRMVTFIEGDSPVQIPNGNSFSIRDDDDVILSNLVCSLYNAYDGNQEMLFSLGPVSSQLTVTGNGSHTISFIGSAGITEFVTSLYSVHYYSASADPTISDGRIVNCTISDGEATSPSSLADISFMEQNNLPIVTLSYDTVLYTEGQSVPVPLAINSTITDADNTDLASLSVMYNNLQGRINFTTSLLPLGVSYTSDCTDSTCSLLVSGSALIADYVQILRNLTYTNNLDEFNFTESVMAVFTVTDDSGNSSAPVSVAINHIPVDDNPPIFAANHITVSVSESEPNSTTVATLVVTDADLPTPEVPVFDIVSGNVGNKFRIVNVPFQGRIILAAPLDFDVVDFYNLTISATSGTHPSAFAYLVLNVINENNKDVRFVNFPSNFSVYEGSEGESLMPPSLSAVDPDGFPISFSVASSYVNINETTGRLRLSSAVDRETSPGTQFTMSVTVTDGVSTDTRTVNVTVLDVNEFSPVFTVLYSANIAENSSPSSTLLTVSATDPDEAPDLSENPHFVSRVTYTLENRPFSDHFNLNSITGALTLISPLDYETTGPSFNLIVTASDNGNNPSPRTTSTIISITVTNINDELPSFVNFTGEVFIDESPRSPKTLVITGSDPDINSRLQYSLDSDELDTIPFTIDNQTGVITVPSDLDVDSVDSVDTYPLILTITDLNTHPDYDANRLVSRNFTIYILDVNDNSPSFTASSYSRTVIENAPVTNLPLLTVEATDADLGSFFNDEPNGNNNVTYSLRHEPSDVFNINPVTGSIYLLKSLDREHREVYRFYAEARDMPIGVNDVPNVVFVEVTITVLDVNEHAPVPDPVNYTASVLESAPINTTIQTYVSIEWSTEGKERRKEKREEGEREREKEGSREKLNKFLIYFLLFFS